MKKVLLLGNGISRLLYKDYINKWKGEIWACNRAFLEYGDRITRIAGHDEVMEEAAA